MSAATQKPTQLKDQVDRYASVTRKIDSVSAMREFVAAYDDMIERFDLMGDPAFEVVGTDEYSVSISS